MKKIIVGFMGLLITVLMCEPAGAWSASGRFGGSASGGEGSWSSTTWFQPSYGANGVYYRVVPTP